MRSLPWSGFALVFLTAGCAGDLCSEDALNDALAGAGSGERVEVGDCEVEATTIVVPAGVTLAGSTASSRLTATGSPAVLTLAADATVELLTVQASGAGVVAQAGAVLRDVVVVGPVVADNAEGIALDDGSRVGVLIRDADAVRLERVTVTGFADLGIAVVDSSEVVLSESLIGRGLGAGLLVSGGSVELSTVELSGMFQGGRLAPVFGGVLFDTSVSSTRLEVCENEGVGLFQDGGTSVHRGARVHENALAGLWAQEAMGFEVSEMSSVERNGGAGIVMINPMGSHVLQNLVVRETRVIPESRGMFSSDGVADGIHLVADNTAALRVADLELAENARSGMLLHVREGMVDLATLMDVTADAAGDAVGVTAQTPTAAIPSGAWDADVTRTGAAIDNDVAPDLLGILGAVEPMGLPAPPL